MPLPQLNTQGIDITNTLRTIGQMDNERAVTEQRNALFGLQKRKLEYDMSPEVLAAQDSMQKAKIAADNALAQEHSVKAQLAAADKLAQTMKSVPYDPELKNYSAFRKSMLEHPTFGNAAKLLPDEKMFLKPNLDPKYQSGFSVPAEEEETFKKVYSSLTDTVADMAEGRKPGTPVKIQVPNSDGSMKTLVVGTRLRDGEVFDPTKEYGPNAKLYEEGKQDKAPEVRKFTEGGNEIDKQYNPATKTWETIPGVTGGPRFKPESDKEKAATVKENFINKNGVHITQFNDGSKWKTISGKLVPIADDDDVGLQRVGDVMSPFMKEALEGGGEEGESTGSSVMDKAAGWVKDKVSNVGEAWSKKPGEVSNPSDSVKTPTGVEVEKPKVATPSNPAKVGGVKEVKSKAERDALPDGTFYIYNGVKYRKQ